MEKNKYNKLSRKKKTPKIARKVVMQAGWSEDTEGHPTRTPCRTSQEGPCVHTGWKSNVSQQGVKAEFIEEKANTDGLGVQKGKEGVLSLFGVWVFYDNCALVYVSSWAYRNWSE